MDEWHQLMAVRALVREGTSNTVGAANGPIFQFLQAGVWIAPAVVTNYTALTTITTPISGLFAQERLFTLLRLNTLFFGLGTLYCLRLILKKYLHINRSFIIFLLFSPGWLLLNNYFKYDITLLFFTSLTLLLLLQYGRDHTLKTYLFAGMSVGFALATKISALPILLLYTLSFFIYEKNWKARWSVLSYGLTTVLCVFALCGIPDLLFLAKGDYLTFLYDNIITVPGSSANFILPRNYYIYLFTHQFYTTFGVGYSLLLLASIFLSVLYRKQLRHTISADEKLMWLGTGLVLCSLLPLKMYMVGNRFIMLFPLIFLVLAISIKKLFAVIKQNSGKTLLYYILSIAMVLQIGHGLAAFSLHILPDPREEASFWIKEHIVNTQIGIENIPVYQMLPDNVLKEYYENLYFKRITDGRTYLVFDKPLPQMPPVVIVTNSETATYFHTTPKKELVRYLEENGYSRKALFTPNLLFYSAFGNKQDLYISGLAAIPTDIAIYSRD
ncbi:glycosyltransferase family 39 protein [Candidatus Woesebacteria bacterium]|nr:glycosyltransferase family 39 protein [Candidatus Woesebacteria bacterium]